MDRTMSAQSSVAPARERSSIVATERAPPEHGRRPEPPCNRLRSLSLKFSVVVLAVTGAVAGCSEEGALEAPPRVVDEWSPPAGAEVDSAKVYRENRHLFDYDTNVPLDVEHVGSWPSGDATAHDLTYASPGGGRVPATLFVPDGPGPFPALVVMHGLPSNRGEMADQATLYAERGAVVITIDAPFARPENTGRRPIALIDRDREEQIQLVIDLRRAIDILMTRSDIDTERMAYLGVSYGASMGGLLAGVEDRLKAYVLQVGDGGLVTHLTGPEDQDGDLSRLPGRRSEQWLEAMWPIEPVHYVAHAAPAALLFQNGTLDDLVLPADGLRFQQAGSEPKTMLWYDTGHGTSPAAFDHAMAFLHDHIGLG